MTTYREYKIIRGEFPDTRTGRQLAFFAEALDRQAADRDYAAMVNTCQAAESLTGDRQWKAIRLTIEAIRLND